MFAADVRRFGAAVLFFLFAAVPALAGQVDELDAAVAGGRTGRFVEGIPAFEVRLLDDGEIRIDLGINSFTPRQLLQVFTALPEFISDSSDLAPGDSLVLRQDGVTGYLTLAAHKSAGDVDFVLTLQAEAPAGIADAAALHGFGLELASMMLTVE